MPAAEDRSSFIARAYMVTVLQRTVGFVCW